jgi:predicted phosphodiesterase
LFLHYHMNENNRFISIDKHPSAEKLDQLYKDSNADIVCFGHHHTLHHFKTKHRHYLNPGALGCNHQPIAPYAILNIKENGLDVTVKEIPYDNREFLSAYEKLKVPARDFILKIFHGDQQLNL